MAERTRLSIVILCLGFAGAEACADLVGADFDNLHPRSGTRDDAGSEAPGADASRTSDAKSVAEQLDAASDGSETKSDVAPPDASASEAGRGGDVDGSRADAIHPPDDAGIGDERDVRKPEDGNVTPDAGGPEDGHHSVDADNHDAPGPDADFIDAADAGVIDVRADAPRPTILVGGFVSLGPPVATPAAIQLRGQMISNATIRGVTSTGISIEGKIQ